MKAKLLLYIAKLEVQTNTAKGTKTLSVSSQLWNVYRKIK